VPLWYCLWVAAWHSGINWLSYLGRYGGWLSVALVAGSRPGISYKEGVSATILSAVCLEWMNEIFDAALNTWLWVFPVFTWQDTGTFALRYCALRLTIALFCLAWSFCYRRIMRGLDRPPPVRVIVFIFACTAFSTRLLYAFTMRAAIPPRPGDEMLLVVGAMGFLLCAAFMCLFYFYIKSLKHASAQAMAMEVAHTPPVWTAAAGVSQAFVERYALSRRETEVVNELLKGRVDKEIAATLDIAVNTVQAHLQRVYNKTGARGRYALMALVRG
jgi:DNA-binding CsgD family transcriptional regulator